MERDREEGESQRCEVYSKKSHGHSGGFHFYMGIRISIFVIAVVMAGSDSTSLWSRLMCRAAILLSLEKLNLAQLVDACLKGTKTGEQWRLDFCCLCGHRNCWKKLEPSEASLTPIASQRYERFFGTCQQYSKCRKREEGKKKNCSGNKWNQKIIMD